MSLPPQISVWDLWSEAARNAENLGDPWFLDCLEAASNNRIFDELSDDNLKTSLSIINSLLNDPKTKPRGLTLFSDFVTQVNPARLIGFQDAVISSLHLVVKGLDSPLANTALVNFLPKMQCMSEVNQVIVTTIVPKILSHFVGENQRSGSQKSLEEIALLKVCLIEYHGPCGHFRDKLEKILVPLIDSENTEIVQVITEVLPLMSYAGGGGNAGEKHIKDWNVMLTKCLKTVYATLLQMYSDSTSSLEENPFDGDQLTGLKRIVEPQVLLKLSLLKRRLHNLLSIISGYLRFPFPAPKLVPQKGILKLIASVISVGSNSVSKKSSETHLSKENTFLAAVAPGVHIMALNLLRNLISCVGTNLFTEGTAVEQMLSSEFKWVQEKPRAFEKLKLELYDTLATWLQLTRGNVTNLKSLAIWVNAIGYDSRVEKDMIELKTLTKPKPGKSVKLMKTSSMTLSSGNATQVFVQKSPELCQASLKTLMYLIHVLDSDNHKKIYEHLLKTASIFCQFQTPPSPYENPLCRNLVYKNLSTLCYSPHPRSPVSLALTVTLLRRGMQDSTYMVSSLCANLVSQLERLLHPVSSPLQLPGPPALPVTLDNRQVVELETDNSDQEDEVLYEGADVTLQNDSSNLVDNTNVSHAQSTTSTASLNVDILLPALKEKIEETLREMFGSIPLGQQNTFQVKSSTVNNGVESSSRFKCQTLQVAASPSDDLSELHLQNGDMDEVLLDDNELPSAILAMNSNGYHVDDNFEDQTLIPNEGTNGDFKRKSNPIDDVEVESVKKSKTTSPIKPVQPSAEQVAGPSVEEMLSSFVDIQPAA